jgi:hypothetical protein
MLRPVALVISDVSEELSASLVFLRSFRQLLVAASVISSSPILDTLMKVALRSTETLVIIRATRRNIQEYVIIHSHRRENRKALHPRKYFTIL